MRGCRDLAPVMQHLISWREKPEKAKTMGREELREEEPGEHPALGMSAFGWVGEKWTRFMHARGRLCEHKNQPIKKLLLPSGERVASYGCGLNIGPDSTLLRPMPIYSQGENLSRLSQRKFEHTLGARI